MQINVVAPLNINKKKSLEKFEKIHNENKKQFLFFDLLTFYEQNNKTLNTEIEELKQKLAEQQQNNETSNIEILKLSKELAEQKQQNEISNIGIEKLQKNDNIIVVNLGEKEKEIKMFVENSTMKDEGLKKQLAEQQRNNETSNIEILKLSKELAEQKQQNEISNIAIEKLKEIKNIIVKNLATEDKAIKMLIENSTIKVERLKKQLVKQPKNNETLKFECKNKECKQGLAEQQQNIETLNIEIEKLRKELAEKQQKIKTSNIEIDQLQEFVFDKIF